MEADVGSQGKVQNEYTKETGHQSNVTDIKFSSTTKENLVTSSKDDERKNDDKSNSDLIEFLSTTKESLITSSKDDERKNDNKSNSDLTEFFSTTKVSLITSSKDDERKNDNKSNSDLMEFSSMSKENLITSSKDDERKNDNKSNSDLIEFSSTTKENLITSSKDDERKIDDKSNSDLMEFSSMTKENLITLSKDNDRKNDNKSNSDLMEFSSTAKGNLITSSKDDERKNYNQSNSDLMEFSSTTKENLVTSSKDDERKNDNKSNSDLIGFSSTAKRDFITSSKDDERKNDNKSNSDLMEFSSTTKENLITSSKNNQRKNDDKSNSDLMEFSSTTKENLITSSKDDERKNDNKSNSDLMEFSSTAKGNLITSSKDNERKNDNKSNSDLMEFSSTTKENLITSSDDDERKNDDQSNSDLMEFSSTAKENLITSSKNNIRKNDDKGNENVDDETKEIQLSLENENLKHKISLLKKSIQFYEKNYVTCDDYKNLQDELESQKRHYEKIIRRKKNDYELRIQELNQKLFDTNNELQKYKNYTESFKTEYRKIQDELDANKEDINILKTNNTALKEEASRYQSALGTATNFRTSDDSVQLKNDILSLQDSIGDYVTNLKGRIEINIDNIEKLIQDYGCLTKITKEKPNKSFIKAILQRYVLNTVIEHARNYFENSASLESDILHKTLHLCSALNKFSESRKGMDTITPTTSIKIRQEACVALSNRGFSETLENNQTIEHDFIKRARHALNNSMNEYRTINDPEKKQSVESMATNIIREIVRIFWFRLRAQEPTVSSSWIDPRVKIDINTMTGRWEKEEEDIDKLIVDMCYFPIVGLNLNDPSKRKLYTRAKVFPAYQVRSYASVTSTLIEQGRKFVRNVIPTKEQADSNDNGK
ncbi:hypothetical protein RclHR1_00260029 [Rhizophagus clarus]|uniref:Uncharacterized protein n=1 Tax=Rhizophagus clarus TaxID=94130 RepID=A0A2Z6RCP5_9GLOM|nr:hypothetical protein RclHR1_00260029 [Rhizophagus clarus]GES97277.1 hypothetical protein GLOIN_2v1716342 [Rhizophagus clarus]